MARSCFALLLPLALCLHDLGADEELRFNERLRCVEVQSVSKAVRHRLENQVDRLGPQFLTVHVDTGTRLPPVVGAYELDGELLRFRPRYAFRPGLGYVARFDARGRLASEQTNETVQVLGFSLPDPHHGPQHWVTAVYPSSNRLPENLLKFYVHFSGPMSRGEAYRRIQILDDAGETVELAFLQIAEELWDPDGTRLTMLFDPGRVKRGLKPRAVAGQVLTAGRRYTLRIDSDWPDANGQRMRNGFEKTFFVTQADYVQPDPTKWSVSAPSAETRDPLELTFVEPLDHAMLSRVLNVIGPDGHRVQGTVSIEQLETRWTFRPIELWKSGEYRLTLDVALEDVAGNSVGRAFEVDPEKTTAAVVHALRFEVRERQ